jgi:histidyl-tRNA synthetase
MKPSIPKGTRDFSANEIAKRNYIFKTIQNTFEKYGFTPIETPSFENLSTLMGKYGEEGDRLIFKILNSGDFLNKVDDNLLTSKNSTKITPQITEKALRYDLTVPFARYVVQHFNELTLPFKRYQIQPVWRADRPQKGRFREFYQCDADVVGSQSLWQEVEFIQLYDDVFNKLKIKDITIHVNNRKILSGLAEIIGAPDKLIDLTVALDKLDKIGQEGVIEEWKNKGIDNAAIDKLSPLFKMEGDTENRLSQMSNMLKNSEIGMQGVNELSFILKTVNSLGLYTANVQPNITLARGLNYYTGTILEVTADKVTMGSVGGGGRYDDLTGIFGRKGLSGMGISFGLDRIYLVMEMLDLFSEVEPTRPDVLLINFGEKESYYAMQVLKKLRENGIKSELYPDAVKMKKQFSYADKRNIPFILIAGEQEIENNIFTLKNMKTGEQKSIEKDKIIEVLKSI